MPKATDNSDISPQQTLLQLLVLTQEQERHNLVQLVHDISLEDLQCPGLTASPSISIGIGICLFVRIVFLPFPEDPHVSSPDEGSRASLKNACVHTLRQMAGTLPTLGEAHTTSRLVQGGQETWPRHQLNNGALDLLTHLMELQEAEAAAVLSALKVRKDIQNSLITAADGSFVSSRGRSVSKHCEMSMNPS